LFSYNELLNLDTRDFELWSSISVISMLKDIQTTSLISNLSFSDQKGWEAALKSASESKILTNDIFDMFNYDEEKQLDKKEFDYEYGWSSVEEYKKHMMLIKAKISGK